MSKVINAKLYELNKQKRKLKKQNGKNAKKNKNVLILIVEYDNMRISDL